ncbi:hypothetical protein TNCV_3270491 [Trichonephila clavipes]|nr:hypothetical protein TNCV_3270491 [Trichonephila clavipes]
MQGPLRTIYASGTKPIPKRVRTWRQSGFEPLESCPAVMGVHVTPLLHIMPTLHAKMLLVKLINQSQHNYSASAEELHRIDNTKMCNGRVFMCPTQDVTGI